MRECTPGPDLLMACVRLCLPTFDRNSGKEDSPMASWRKKTAETTANLTGLIGATYSLLTKRSLPQKSGKLLLNGLHSPVEILTDTYGVPHIYAANEDDLYFAQGYVHAQERLWQMEFNRRVGSGRLSE